jgi:hypothetical protein
LRLSRIKVLYLTFFGLGSCIGLAPFIAAAISGDESHINKPITPVAVILGFCLLIGASIIQKIFFRCPNCKKNISSNYSFFFGLVGLIIDTKNDVKARNCPHCFAELK